jgi:hypothetical protein
MTASRAAFGSRAAARVALAALLVAAASRAAAQEDPPAASFTTSDAEPPPSEPPAPAPVRSRGEGIVRPHVDLGVLGGGQRLGFGLQAGIRFHPVLVLWSGFVVGGDQQYLAFSGVKVGYQHTLSRWWALYGAAGIGSAWFYDDARGVTTRGSATVLDVGVTVCPERGENALSCGAELLMPNAPSGTPAGTMVDTAVMFTLSVNPLIVLAGRIPSAP